VQQLKMAEPERKGYLKKVSAIPRKSFFNDSEPKNIKCLQ